jgi:hypothetical protein
MKTYWEEIIRKVEEYYYKVISHKLERATEFEAKG